MTAYKADNDPTAREFIRDLRQQVVGQGQLIDTPFGGKPLLYCDHTASGRSLHSIEQIIAREVLPHYANTHSEASHTGRRTGQLREWARQSIKDVINAGEEDALIFCGHGATGAVNTLVHLLHLNAAPQADDASNPIEAIRPLVLIGPYEHHSNELPWREAKADVIRIPLDEDGNVDQSNLIRTLKENHHRPFTVGSFSAASNVTGIKADVPSITRILKRHGALAVWDYAAGAPYLPIDMNRPDAAIDAVFFSPHKFIGGPGSSGVLAVKRSVIRNTAPGQIGGGTVRYVTPDWHDWHPDPEHREEGGTPGIIESIRGAMAVSIPAKLGYQRLAEIEQTHVHAAQNALLNTPGLELLGSSCSDRLPIFSVRFRSAEGELHYGFVVRLLNDLFGIQARGGCSCAGPYGHSLLQLTPEYSESLADAVGHGFGCLRPGWVRFNLHWLCSEKEVDYILAAVKMIAKWGRLLLPSYTLDTASGLWEHRDSPAATPVSLDPFTPCAETVTPPHDAFAATALLREAERTLRGGAPDSHRACAIEGHQKAPWPSKMESLCWFLRAHEGP
jgi:selenocysteine lyase/cysteine desulfurase